jgi:integrase/recombinase XerD
MPEEKELQHVPVEYQTHIKAGNTGDESDRRQLLRVDDYLDFVGTDVTEHDFETVESYIKHCIVNRDNGRRYVRQQFFFIRKYYDWLIPKTLAENPCDHVDTVHYFGRGQPQSKKDKQADGDAIYYFEPDEVDELITHAPEPVARNRLLIKMMFVTGPRAKEARQLRWDDVDNHDKEDRVIRYITAKKRGETEPRHVPYPPSLDRYLRNWKRKQKSRLGGAESPFVFSSRSRDDNGDLRPISTETVNKIVKSAARDAGLQETLYIDANGRERVKYSSHSLRHSYAVYFVQSGDGKGPGGDLKSLKDLMGHSSTAITERYLRFKSSTLMDLGRKHGPA